jgi:hypothetical protein
MGWRKEWVGERNGLAKGMGWQKEWVGEREVEK